MSQILNIFSIQSTSGTEISSILGIGVNFDESVHPCMYILRSVICQSGSIAVTETEVIQTVNLISIMILKKSGQFLFLSSILKKILF